MSSEKADDVSTSHTMTHREKIRTEKMFGNTLREGRLTQTGGGGLLTFLGCGVRRVGTAV